jgi:hypothetical protein
MDDFFRQSYYAFGYREGVVMKQAYVSLILASQENKPSAFEILRIDSFLSQITRNHEIIVLDKSNVRNEEYESLKLTGPLTVVITRSDASRNELAIAGLGRSVGDFILEWSHEPSKLQPEIVIRFLDPTDRGIEIVEGLPLKNTISSNFFYQLTNRFRSHNHPIIKSLGRLYSRRALNWILEASYFESHLMVLVAEIPFQKSAHILPFNSYEMRSLTERFREGIVLLTKGSRFVTVVPLLLAGLSSISAVLVAIYAVAVFVLFGSTPEGWTSLAVVIGLGQGAILALIGMVWSRLDTLAKGLSRKKDVTADVEIVPASL